MYKISGQAVSEDTALEEVSALEWKFQIDNGNVGELAISDELLDTELLATERAKSEFLKNSYKLNEIQFTTYLTNITKNMTINVYGVPYLVKSINTVITPITIKTSVKAVRYE